MFSHIFVGITDFETAFNFYPPVMAALGYPLRHVDWEKPWAGWQVSENMQPYFWISEPFDGGPACAGNGQMVAFLAPSRAHVVAAYQAALANGGTDEGPPSLRPHYHAHYFGAYFRDPDGNKLCAVCHDIEG